MLVTRISIFTAIITIFTHTALCIDLADLDDWNIVVAADAIPSEKYAAEEFQKFLDQATGRKLPIVHQTKQPVRHIFIGSGPAMRASSVGFATTDMGPEDLRIVVGDNNIVIAGGATRGTLYGVYTFLEDYLGVRFLTAQFTHIPTIKSSLLIEPVDRSYHPPFAYRMYLKQEVMTDLEFGARRRQNASGHNARQESRFGERFGGEAIGGVYLHNNFQLDGVSFDEHPECFCLYQGERRPLQPCLSHPLVRELVLERVMNSLPHYRTGDTIPLAQNDAPGGCECEKCAQIQREGDEPGEVPVPQETPMGLSFIPVNGPPSALIIDFVNYVAEHVADERPDLFVGTEAYSYSMMPPRKTKTLPNVKVQLAMYHACVMHAFDDADCPVNSQTGSYLRGWGESCQNLLFWHYDLNPRDYLYLAPNLRALGSHIQAFQRGHGQGIFMQGPARNAEFSDLRAYVTTSLIWDPSQDIDVLIDEFLQLYYRQSAKPIRRWIDLVHDQAVTSGKHTNINFTPISCGMDQELGDQGVKLFAEAMALADDDEIRNRVEKVSVTALRLALEPVFWNAIEAPRRVIILKDTTLEKELMPLDEEEKQRLRPQVRQLFELCSKHAITVYMEGAYTTVALDAVRKYYGLSDGEPL